MCPSFGRFSTLGILTSKKPLIPWNPSRQPRVVMGMAVIFPKFYSGNADLLTNRHKSSESQHKNAPMSKTSRIGYNRNVRTRTFPDVLFFCRANRLLQPRQSPRPIAIDRGEAIDPPRKFTKLQIISFVDSAEEVIKLLRSQIMSPTYGGRATLFRHAKT